MGIRPRKTIGWVVQTVQDNVHLDTVDTIRGLSYDAAASTAYSYQGFYDYIEPYLLGQYLHAYHGHRPAMDQYNITKFVNLIVADEEYGDDDAVYAVFYPMLLTPYGDLSDPGGAQEFQSGDTAFVHAELEHLAPHAYRTLETFTYGVNSPIFPSEYSVIERGHPRTLEHFTLLQDRKKQRDIYIALRRLQNNEPGEAELRAMYAQFAGFDSIAALADAYELAPPEDLFAFAHYLNIFKDPSVIYEMRPQVVYYWT